MNNLDAINKYILENAKSGKINKRQAVEVLSIINGNKISGNLQLLINRIGYEKYGTWKDYSIIDILDGSSFEAFLEKLVSLSKTINPTGAYTQIEKAEELEYYPLSSPQNRVFYANILDETGISYNIPQIISLDNDIDIKLIEEIIRTLIKRHEILRTSFMYFDDVPMQVVHKDIDFNMDMPITAPGKSLEDVFRAFVRPFDLSVAPLFRAVKVSLQEDRHVILVDMHHIIADGYSWSNILAKELLALIRGETLPEPRLQYRDFAVWQRKLIDSGAFEKMKSYWMDKFSSELPVLNMPLDYPRPAVTKFEGDYITFEADSELSGKLKKLSAKNGATLYMTLMAAYNVLLSKYTGQEDIIVGAVSMGRRNPDLGNIVGMFVNTLVLRNYPEGNKTFRMLLQEVKENMLGAFENEDFQYDELVKALGIKRDISRNPLFDTAFFMQSHMMSENNLMTRLEKKTAQFDITIEGIETNEEIRFLLEYSTRLYKKTTMEGLAKHFVNILKQVTVLDEVKLCDIDILCAAEKRQILVEFNRSAGDYPKDKTIHELFEAQVEKTPDNIAVEYEDKTLTYKELNEKVNQLAKVLREKGVKPDMIVGIMVERSFEMLIGIMSILKAGGAYLPIDPSYPSDRISYMLENSGATLLLTMQKHAGKGKFNVETMVLDDVQLYIGDVGNPEHVNNSSDLAYVIYTSGSTGKPKGVMIEHYSLINRLWWMQKKYPINETDTIMQKTAYTFDVSVWELFWWAINGAKLCLLEPGGEKDPTAIVNCIHRYNVTVMHFVPSMLGMFLEYTDNPSVLEKISGLRQVFASGESLKPQQVVSFYRLFRKYGTKLANLYGPTEATVDVSYYDCHTDNTDVIPIGKPIDNIRLYIIDSYKKPMPVGVIGELCIGGDGLARGYLNNRELTEETFIECPFIPGERIYKTGDMARWLPDGNIEYLGRIDHQVKIRGFRIELGEIESKLLAYETIKEAAVAVREDGEGNKQLCAYLVSDAEITVPDIRKFLSMELPEYMIPAYFVRLEKMPLSPNGKLDRKLLPEKSPTINEGTMYIAPVTDMEKELARVWEEVLKTSNISIRANFFNIGGDSFKALKVVSRGNGLFTLIDLYENPTIEGLGRKISQPDENNENLIYKLGGNVEAADVSLLCIPYGGGNAMVFKPLAEALTEEWDNLCVYSVNLPRYKYGNVENANKSVYEIARDCVEEIQKKIKTSVILYGHCVGSALTIEIAKLLEMTDYNVKTVIIGAALAPKFSIFEKEATDFWKGYSDEDLLKVLREAGGFEEEMDKEELKTIMKNFRDDVKSFSKYFFDNFKNREQKKLTASIQCVIGDKDGLTRKYHKKYKEWSRFSDEVGLHVIKEGNHYFLKNEAHELAQIIINNVFGNCSG